jgi:hypothetical protein
MGSEPEGDVVMRYVDADPQDSGAVSTATAGTTLRAEQPPLLPDQVAMVRSDETAQVLSQFQQIMERFLETQQRVMLTYLTGTTSAPVDAAATGEMPPIRSMPPRLYEAPPEPPRAVEPRAASIPEPPVTDWLEEVARQPAKPAAPATGGKPQYPEVMETLLQIVSDRTGYPVDMLGLDMNMEADLGIDSIKRVEITAELQRIVLGEGTALVGDNTHRLTEIKTLRGLAEAMASLAEGSGAPFAHRPVVVVPKLGPRLPGAPTSRPPPMGDGLAAE